MTKKQTHINELISTRFENLLRKEDPLTGLVEPSTIYMSPPEFNRLLSHFRFSVDEIKDIVNTLECGIEVERPACHRIAVHLDGGDE